VWIKLSVHWNRNSPMVHPNRILLNKHKASSSVKHGNSIAASTRTAASQLFPWIPDGEEEPEPEDSAPTGASPGCSGGRNRSLRRGLTVPQREPRLRPWLFPLGHPFHHQVRSLSFFQFLFSLNQFLQGLLWIFFLKIFYICVMDFDEFCCMCKGMLLV
jgi:hypothetical protein